MEQGQSLEEEARLMVALRGNSYLSSFTRSAAATRAPREEVTEYDTGGGKTTLSINTLCSGS